MHRNGTQDYFQRCLVGNPAHESIMFTSKGLQLLHRKGEQCRSALYLDQFFALSFILCMLLFNQKMVYRCCAINCENSKTNRPNLKFFRFPSNSSERSVKSVFMSNIKTIISFSGSRVSIYSIQFSHACTLIF